MMTFCDVTYYRKAIDPVFLLGLFLNVGTVSGALFLYNIYYNLVPISSYRDDSF